MSPGRQGDIGYQDVYGLQVVNIWKPFFVAAIIPPGITEIIRQATPTLKAGVTLNFDRWLVRAEEKYTI